MPEGPEIRLAADRVENAIAKRIADRVVFAFDHLKLFEKRLSGQTIMRVDTRGKAMLTHFDNGWTIYSHNQLYGRWYICKRGQIPKTSRQLRLALHNSEFSALLYSASDISVIKTNKLSEHPFLARLGPDVLNEKPTIKGIQRRLESDEFCRRQLGALLINQRFVAGLGNYLRAEILTLAKIHPLKKPMDCSSKQMETLARLIIQITRRSYRTQGIVNPPSLVTRLKASGLKKREQYRFNTYGRSNQLCHYCQTEIEVMMSGGRKMYFCPGCQRLE